MNNKRLFTTFYWGYTPLTTEQANQLSNDKLVYVIDENSEHDYHQYVSPAHDIKYEASKTQR